MCSGWEKWRNKIVPPTCTRHPCTHKNPLRVGGTLYTTRVRTFLSGRRHGRRGGTKERARERAREREKNRRVGSNRVSRNEGNFILRKEG